MGVAEYEIDSWLCAGGLVVTASDRSARALVTAFHRTRCSEGLAAWPVPNVLTWKNFVQAAWEQRTADGRLLLNPTQEQALWADILAQNKSQPLSILLEGPRFRLAKLAIEAHELLCLYAPKYLQTRARSTWQQDSAAFSGWLAACDEICHTGNLLSPSRLPLELISLLQSDATKRPPILLAGFDRIMPIQRSLFDAWGAWREVARGEPAASISFYEAADFQSELTACALWCRNQLTANPRSRLLVVTQAAEERRGEIERAFLRYASSNFDSHAAPSFEFSLGVPLSQIALPKAARLVLRWLFEPVAEHELDWLFSTGQIATYEESLALQAALRALRGRGLERPDWSLAAFLNQTAPPAGWSERLKDAQRRLAAVRSQLRSPLDWSQLAPQLLECMGWPGTHTLSSAEFQAIRRWRQALDTAGSLGFDGRRIRWAEFLSLLERTLDATLFAPESRGAPIQIAGPAESAGLSADAVWFLGADEGVWPPGGTTHPLLPLGVQRESEMPHASPQLDWELAQAITTRLVAAAPELHFSYARQNATAEARPSRLIVQLVGPPQSIPTELTTSVEELPLTVTFEDFSRIPFSPGKVEGGAGVLTAQSQCPFKAFASARLAAQGWQPAEAILTPSQRGQLLHAALHSLWAGPPGGIRTRDDLLRLPDRRSFVADLIQRVFQQELRPALRERMPRRYLELEEQRLVDLVSEWLDYEATRIDFKVAETEAERTVHLAGLTFDLRLDRIDRLNDASLLVIDYKTGDVSPKAWELPRPEDVQLPLYAGFALDEELGGLVFAKVRRGGCSFAGQVANAKATLLHNLSASTCLMKNPLTAEQLIDWRDCIEQLARDFLDGRAEVDPREAPKSCEHCGLEALCRIQENQAQSPNGDEDPDQTQEADPA